VDLAAAEQLEEPIEAPITLSSQHWSQRPEHVFINPVGKVVEVVGGINQHAAALALHRWSLLPAWVSGQSEEAAVEAIAVTATPAANLLSRLPPLALPLLLLFLRI
jgi:hypothetical protein